MIQRHAVFCAIAALFCAGMGGAVASPVPAPSVDIHQLLSGATATSPSPAPAKHTMPPAVARAAQQFNLALAAQRAGKLAEAISDYRLFLQQAKAAGIAPAGLLPAYQNLSLLYSQTGDRAGLESALQQMTALGPKDAGAWARLAALYGDAHRFAAAKQAANRAIALNPPPAVAAAAHFALGQTARAQRDFVTAEREFGITYSLAPKNPQALFNWALMLVQNKKFDASLTALRRLRIMSPDMLQAPRLMAAVLQERGSFNESLAVTDSILKRKPNDVPSLGARAYLLDRIGRRSEAITAYLKVLDHDPHNLGARLNLGQLYIVMNNYAAARIHLAAALPAAPKNPRLLAALGFAETQLAGGVGEMSAKDNLFTAAEKHLTAAARLVPEDRSVQLTLGQLYERLGRYADALVIYRKMKAARPTESFAYYQIARVFTEQMKTDEIVANWHSYRQLRPDDAVSYREAAGALQAQGRMEEANREWRAELERNPKDAVAMVAVAANLARLKQPEEARKQYQAVLSLDISAPWEPKPTRAMVAAATESSRLEALRGLARLSQDEGKTDDVVAWWNLLKSGQTAQAERTHQLPDPEAYLAIAHAYEQQKKYEMAVEEMRSLSRALPADAVPYNELSRLYLAQNLPDESIAAKREAIRRSADPALERSRLAQLLQSRRRNAEAVAEYVALAKDYPLDKRFHTEQALAYEQSGQDEKALAIYNALLTANAADTAALTRKALVLTRLKRWDAARAAYETLLSRDPRDPVLYADLSHLYALQDRSPEYLKWLQTKLEGTATPSQTLMSAVWDEFIRQKREADAVTYTKDLAARHPADRGFRETYAGTLSGHGREADALAIYEAIASEHPNDVPAGLAVAASLDRSDRPADATAKLAALAAQPGLSELDRRNVRTQLVERYTGEGKLAEAGAVYRDILKAAPADLNAKSSLAGLLQRIGGEVEAAGLYSEMAQSLAYPQGVRVDLRKRAGSLFEKQGKKEAALAQYREALLLEPKDTDAAAAIARLSAK